MAQHLLIVDDDPTREGARDFLVKPLDLQELRGLVDRLLADRVGPP